MAEEKADQLAECAGWLWTVCFPRRRSRCKRRTKALLPRDILRLSAFGVWCTATVFADFSVRTSSHAARRQRRVYAIPSTKSLCRCVVSVTRLCSLCSMCRKCADSVWRCAACGTHGDMPDPGRVHVVAGQARTGFTWRRREVSKVVTWPSWWCLSPPPQRYRGLLGLSRQALEHWPPFALGTSRNHIAYVSRLQPCVSGLQPYVSRRDARGMPAPPLRR